MSLLHSIISASYLPLRLAKSIGSTLGIKSESSLRLLLYHDIDPLDHHKFEMQLRWLKRY